MSGTLAIQDGKLIMQGGKLGFCCCPSGCQWVVEWDWNCGTCVDPGGVYAGKIYTVGTPYKITSDLQVPGDYPNFENTVVIRYGANPASDCGAVPGLGDIDITTQPSVAGRCYVLWDPIGNTKHVVGVAFRVVTTP